MTKKYGTLWALTLCLSTVIAVRVGISGQPASKLSLEPTFESMKVQRDVHGHITSALPSQEAAPLKRHAKVKLEEKLMERYVRAYLDAWIQDAGESKENWRVALVQKSSLGATAEIEHLYEGLPVWPYHYMQMKMDRDGSLQALEASLPDWQRPLGGFSLTQKDAVKTVQRKRKSSASPDAILQVIFVEAPSGQGHYAFRVFVSGEEWILTGAAGTLLSFRSNKKHLMNIQKH
jgi:hypothetical protein